MRMGKKLTSRRLLKVVGTVLVALVPSPEDIKVSALARPLACLLGPFLKLFLFVRDYTRNIQNLMSKGYKLLLS